MLSPVGPALHDEGGSRPRSINSCKIQVSQPLIKRRGSHLQAPRAVRNVHLVNALEGHLCSKAEQLSNLLDDEGSHEIKKMI